jgi:hypothetical protein
MSWERGEARHSAKLTEAQVPAGPCVNDRVEALRPSLERHGIFSPTFDGHFGKRDARGR